MQQQYPIVTPIKYGWAAHGDGWAVHGPTKEAAIEAYWEAERKHREIMERPEKGAIGPEPS